MGLKCIILVWLRLQILAGILFRLIAFSGCTVLGLKTITNGLDTNSTQIGVVYDHPHNTLSMITQVCYSFYFILSAKTVHTITVVIIYKILLKAASRLMSRSVQPNLFQLLNFTITLHNIGFIQHPTE